MEKKADIILSSESIFTALDQKPFAGYVAILGDRICKAEKGAVPAELIGKDTKVIELGNRTLCPGFIDVHCFFSGYVVRFLGEDLSECISDHQAVEKLRSFSKEGRPVFGHELRVQIKKEDLDAAFPDRPVVAFMKGCEACCMNQKAIDEFDFTPDRCYPEAYVKLFPYILGNKEFIKPQFIDYMKMMNSKGVTSIKEMGFDDYYGFTDVLAELEKEDKLSLRVNFMSQPVAKEINFEYGEAMLLKFFENVTPVPALVE